MRDESAKPAKKRGRPRARITLARGRRTKVIRTGLHEQATDRLRSLIIKGELAPGAKLGEAELSGLLGVSRTPLREALKLLATEGLVELRPNRTARVREMLAQEVEELFEAVAGIERVAAEMAAERITARELRRLHLLQASMEQHYSAGQLEPYFALNQQIHCLIVAAAKNGPLRDAHERLIGRAERARYLALSARNRWDESVEEHRQILDALVARNGEQAGRLLRRHVLRTGVTVQAALGRDMGAEHAPIQTDAA